MKDNYKTNTKSKLSMATKNDRIESLREELAELNEQYDELLTRYKKSGEKLEK